QSPRSSVRRLDASSQCSPNGRKTASGMSHQTPCFQLEETTDDRCRLLPILSLRLQLLASFPCQPIKARPSIGLRGAPLRCDCPFLLQFEQHRVERTLIHGKHIPADLLDTAGNSIPVERAEHIESLEDHES